MVPLGRAVGGGGRLSAQQGRQGMESGYGAECVKYGEVLRRNASKSLMFGVAGCLRAYVQRSCSFEIKKQHVDNCEDVQVVPRALPADEFLQLTNCGARSVSKTRGK